MGCRRPELFTSFVTIAVLVLPVCDAAALDGILLWGVSKNMLQYGEKRWHQMLGLFVYLL